MRMRFWQGAMAVAVLMWSVSSSAALVGRDLDGNLSTFEAYYDTVLNITWLANANAGAGSSYDDGSSTSDGRMTWSNATSWAASLNPYGSGITGWRLPATGPLNGSTYNYVFSYNGSTDYGYNQSAPGTTYAGSTGSEMAHLFFNTLGNLAYCHPTSSTPLSCVGPQSGWGLTNTGPFSNLQSIYYWSGTVYAPDPSSAWYFNFSNGTQRYAFQGNEFRAWAVHSGPVGAPAPVPLPAAAWLLGSGLLGLLGLARARRSALG